MTNFLFDQVYDKTYVQIKRSTSLDWKEKAIITHIINWQEKTDKKTGKQCICFQSNGDIADELGMSPSTLEKLITRMNKNYPTFFKSEKASTEKKTGGYYNRTNKTVNVPALLKFLETDAAKIKVQTLEITEAPAVKPEFKEEPVIDPQQQSSTPDDLFDGFDFDNVPVASKNANLKDVDVAIQKALAVETAVQTVTKKVVYTWCEQWEAELLEAGMLHDGLNKSSIKMLMYEKRNQYCEQHGIKELDWDTCVNMNDWIWNYIIEVMLQKA